MVNRTNYWKLGAFVLVATLVGLGTVVWIGAYRLTRETIIAYMYFDEAVSGLEHGSPVKFRGVTIGVVADIKTAPDRRHVEVQAKIFTDSLARLGLRDPANPPRPGVDPFVPPDMRVQLVSSALTGLSYVNVDFFDPARYPVPTYPFETPWNTVLSEPSAFKSLESGLMQTLDRLPHLSDAATRVLTRLDGAIAELETGALSKRALSLMHSVEGQVESIAQAKLVERGSELLAGTERTLEEIRLSAAEIRARDGPVHRVADRLDALGRRIEKVIDDADVGAAVAAIRNASDQLGAAAEEATRLGQGVRGELGTLRSLREALDAVRRLAELLERDPGVLLRGKTVSQPPNRRQR